MTKIYRSDFVRSHETASLDLNRVKQDPESLGQLERAGIDPRQLDKADLDRDGRIAGRNELQALYQEADRFDSDGDATSVVATDRAGLPTPAGQAVSTLGLLLRNSEDRRPQLNINGSVGPGQANRRDDVLAVQQRLKDLGLDVAVDGRFGPGTQSALKTYEAMVGGYEETSEADGVVKPNSELCRALASPEARRWERMPAADLGFVNNDSDGFSHGSSRTADVIRDVGQRYNDAYRADNPAAALIDINDVSTRKGGKNRDHSTHQAGLDIDVRLPRTDGVCGTQSNWRNYDRETAYQMIKAFAQDERVERVLFHDPTLLRRLQREAEAGAAWASKIEDGGTSHRDHFHVDIKAPGVPEA